MDIALLNTRITIQKNELVTDAIGNHKNTWTDWFSCAATINGESGSETENAGQTEEHGTCAFTVRWCSETAAVVPDQYRILWDGGIYDITGIDHQNNKHKALKFRCREVRR